MLDHSMPQYPAERKNWGKCFPCMGMTSIMSAVEPVKTKRDILPDIISLFYHAMCMGAKFRPVFDQFYTLSLTINNKYIIFGISVRE